MPRRFPWVVPPVSARDLAFYTSGCRQPGPSPACCVPRRRQTGKWQQSAARTRRAGAQEVAQRRLRLLAGRHVETECSGRKEFNAGALPRASASVREDRPHREPVPARQEAPCHLTCSIGRDLPKVVVVRRSGTGARAQNAKKQRRARQRTGQIGKGMRLLRPDDLLFDASWPSRPGCDGQRGRAVGTADMLPSPPARRHPPDIAAFRSRPICPLPTQQRTARRLLRMTGRRHPLLSPAPSRPRLMTLPATPAILPPRSLSSRAPWTVAGMTHS